ncbi:hypothetical protein, partial [Pseudomonas aeruginosa]|uniref:hypothetical protein n=1 Tax=Pseudomonas aeruginosa TaxID=287 RepID=UPI0030634588
QRQLREEAGFSPGDTPSEDVVQLAHHVRQKVGEKFNVWLEPEVRFIGASGEVSAVETIS